MALYEASTLSILVTATAGAPLVAIKGHATRLVRVRQMELYYATAPTTSGNLGLTRATVVAVTPTGAQVGQSRSGSANDPASTTQLETGWGTVPVVTAANTFRRWSAAPTIGNGVIWTWWEGDGLLLPATAELCIINLTATAPGTFQWVVIYDE